MGNVVAATAQFTPPGCDLERHRELLALLESRRGAMKGLAHSSSKVARWAWCGMPGREGLGGGRGTVSGLLHWRLEASRQLTGSVEG